MPRMRGAPSVGAGFKPAATSAGEQFLPQPREEGRQVCSRALETCHQLRGISLTSRRSLDLLFPPGALLYSPGVARPRAWRGFPDAAVAQAAQRTELSLPLTNSALKGLDTFL